MHANKLDGQAIWRRIPSNSAVHALQGSVPGLFCWKIINMLSNLASLVARHVWKIFWPLQSKKEGWFDRFNFQIILELSARKNLFVIYQWSPNQSWLRQWWRMHPVTCPNRHGMALVIFMSNILSLIMYRLRDF